MANTVCTNLAKGLLIFIGVCYLASAGGMSYVSIWVFSTYDNFDNITDSCLTLLPASIILGVSSLMCIIGILACIAACKSNKILLSVFFCLVLTVLVGEILAGTLGYVYRAKINGIIDDDLTNAINKYNVTSNKEQIDYMQHEFSCCGVHNATDWLDSDFWKTKHTDTVPMSCCKPVKQNETCVPFIGSSAIYHKGCLVQLDDEFNKNLIYMASAAVFLATMQFVALIGTCILVCRTKEEIQYQVLNEQIGGGLTI